MSSKRDKPAGSGGPASLSSVQVDVTTRLGALTPATPTGLGVLDRMLAGGLRAGAVMAISGVPGVGKTAFSLTLAYMAARARAGVVFTSVALDETEVMARLASRALHREHPDALTAYGAIWSGQAWQDDDTRRVVNTALETVVKKVGTHLHMHRAVPFESTHALRSVVAHLWDRHDRVVLVLDGVEAFSVADSEGRHSAQANASFDGRIAQVAYELRKLSEQGCAIVITAQARNAELISPAATLSTELRAVERSPTPMAERLLALGARPVDLVVTKNAVGPTGIVPLRFIAGAATFEERGP